MNRTLSIIAAVAALAFPLASFADVQERNSTIADRESVNLTVYNGGTALVHDRRRVSLQDGRNRIAWKDVSANIDATSALIESPGSAGSITMLEQNFNYDLLNPQVLLQKYVGRDVTVIHDARFAGERDTRETARILSINGGIVLQYRDRIETELRGHIAFPRGSKNVRAEPTLDLDLASAHSGSQTLDLSYLTSGMGWRADYVGVLSSDESRLTLRGLVTLSNATGIAYENARLQLVAGTVNVANPTQLPYAMKEIARVTTSDVYSTNVSQENYFEYHLYTLARPTTILNAQTKQVSLLSARDIPTRKTLELRGSPTYYRSLEPDLGDRLPIGVYLTFENRGGDLGIPLPAGVVRLYKNDSRGLAQFLGSDTIDHTPKNDVVRLHLGNSFDIVARKRQTDFHLLRYACASESSYEITFTSGKREAQDVLVVEPIPGDWKMTSESQRHVKSSASTATWTVRVPADGRAQLQYTAQTNWC